MSWFKKKNKSGDGKEQTKCDGCGKMKSPADCNKSADGKCLCKDCAK